MYQLAFYVPATHVEQVKKAVFAAGGGRIGNYEHCAWQVLGQGQFRPTAGANPHIGQVGSVETLDEYRVELVVRDELIGGVVAALRRAHPYEEPAYSVMRLESY